jgi:DNA (cytosine-5)-methyltransferase 1
MKFGSLFSGIGGFDKGFEDSGMECAWQCEIDPKASEVLAKHWPDVKRYTDVREIGKHNLEPVDVICGGFPCQDLSIAGKRAGLTGGRSGLWFEFARIIDELEPKWVVIENVPGLLSSSNGKDFAVIVRWLVERGYGVCWRVLDSQYFGVAQRRRRVFVVASFGNGRSAEILFESEGLSWDSPARGEAGQGTAGTFTVRSGSDGGGKGYLGLDDGAMTLGGQPQWVTGVDHELNCKDELMGTLNRNGDADSGISMCPNTHTRIDAETETFVVPLVGVRRLTPTECARLQGFSDDWNSFQSDSSRYKQFGNAVTVNVAEWIGKRIMEAVHE